MINFLTLECSPNEYNMWLHHKDIGTVEPFIWSSGPDYTEIEGIRATDRHVNDGIKVNNTLSMILAIILK